MHSFPCSGKTEEMEDYKNDNRIILSLDEMSQIQLTQSEKDTRTKNGKVIVDGYVFIKGADKSTKSLTHTVENLLKVNKKIVLDGTFKNDSIRKPFIDLTKKHNKTIGCHIITGEETKPVNPITGKKKKTIAQEDMKAQAIINSFFRQYELNGELYFTEKDCPATVKKDGQSWVLPYIFAYLKTPKNRPNYYYKYPEKVEGFDEIYTQRFKRKNLYPQYTNKVVLIDFDSTIRKTISGNHYPTTLGDQVLLPNTIKVLKEYKDNDYLVIAITNQSGVAKGEMTIEELELICNETNKLTGGLIDAYYYCPHRGGASCGCRKPQPGLFIKAMHEHQIDFSQSFYVGDLTGDFTAAHKFRDLGFKFYTEKEFFNR